MKLLSTTTAFTLSTLTNAWQNEQGNWGECGRLPNFNALLQESNYNVAYELDEKFMQHVAKVSPANCQADIDKDQGKYDKYIAKKDKKNKEKDAAKAKRKAEAAAKKKQKMKDREEKLKAKEEAKSNGEDIPRDEKNEKSKKSEEEKREIRLKKKQERDAAKAEAAGSQSQALDVTFDEFDQSQNMETEGESFGNYLESFMARRRRKRASKKVFKATGFDKLKASRIGIYYCDPHEKVWVENRPVRDICTADLAAENFEVLDTTDGIHIEGNEECPRNHIWDAENQEFIMNPCSMLGDLFSWPMTNGGCLNARSLIYVKEGKSNYKFIATKAKIKAIPCGFSIKELLRQTAADYDQFHYLQMVRINYNEISHIPCSFLYNIATNELNMDNNRISKICPNMLQMANRAGNEVFLSSIVMSNNQLELDDLEPRFFKHSNVTQYFKLNSNNLNGVHKAWFSDIPLSKTINLANNTISNLNDNTFIDNTEIQFLLLSMNGLEEVSAGLTSSMKNLRRIWLNDNKE